MKTLDDGTNIPARMYYYLLDNFNYRHPGHNIRIIGLTKERFAELFKEASELDLKENF